MRAQLLLLGVAVSLTLTACGDDSDHSTDTTSATPSTRITPADVAVVELLTGDCISGLVIGAAERTRSDSVRVVDCESVHELEVFATFELPPTAFDDTDDDAYPGEQRVVREADAGCAERLAALGLDSELGLIAMWPTGVSWMQGDREVTCAAFSKDGRPFESRRVLASRED